MQKDKTELEVTRMTKENIQYLNVYPYFMKDICLTADV